MDLSAAIEWAAGHRNGVLITLRRDGRAQSSDIVYAVKDGEFHISLTDSRAKTRNMRRDPRVILHISDPTSWSYVSIDAEAELSPVAAQPHDATVNALAELYRTISGGDHPDWEEYREAMISEGRLIARIIPKSVTGQIR